MADIMDFGTDEQETSLAFMRGDKTIKVYTSDKTMITKLMKITDSVEILTTNERGTITSAYFKLRANQLHFRKEPSKKPLTEEQKRQRAIILQKARGNLDK